MDYLKIINIITASLSLLFAVMSINFLIFFIVGIFKKKRFPHTDEKLKYGLIIPARNEEAVVGNLIKSIQKNKYPQDKLEIFVIAHNCTDNTAKIARELGATVYEYNNSNERTMGYAFRYLFDRIREDKGVENYDGFFLFNADNILSEDYIDKMNDAFVANGREKVITSFRNSKNFGSNTISAMYGIFFMQGCRFEARGRTVCGCSTRVQGTGYVISSDIVKDGWKYVTLTEDWEFSTDQILRNNKIVYCDDAVFYDEQPTNVKIMLRQRLRWAKGHLLVCTTRLKDVLKSLFKPKRKGGCQHKFSLYDIMINILPFYVVSAGLFLVSLIGMAFAPLAGFSAAEVWKNWAIGFGFGAAVYYIGNFLTGALLLILEHKRIKNAGFFTLLSGLIFWPLFQFLTIPIGIVSLFRKVEWKAIPHDDTTTFEQVNVVTMQNEIVSENVEKLPETGTEVVTSDDNSREEEPSSNYDKLKEYNESHKVNSDDENKNVGA